MTGNYIWIKRISLVLFVITAIVIFGFSAQLAPKSLEISDKVGTAVNIETFGKYEHVSAQPLLFGLNIRKYAHITLFALLGFFSIPAFGLWLDRLYKKVPAALTACFLYAVSDEVHQLFVSGRNGKPSDVLIDMIGVCIGILFATIIELTISCKLDMIKRKNTDKREI